MTLTTVESSTSRPTVGEDVNILYFYKGRRDCFSQVRSRLLRQTVQSVHTEVKLLTDKERGRLGEVRSNLSSGVNPYHKAATNNVVGGQTEKITIKRDLSESQVKSLESKWSKRDHIHIDPVTYLPEEYSLYSKEEIESYDPSKLHCSFCGVEVEESTATRGVDKPKKKITFKIIDDRLEEEVIHYSPKTIACSECVLNIKPILDKDGNIIRQGIKFPEFD